MSRKTLSVLVFGILAYSFLWVAYVSFRPGAPLREMVSCHQAQTGDAGASAALALSYNAGLYPSKVSALPGESIGFHLSGAQGPLTFYREGASRQKMGSIARVQAGSYSCTGKEATGCSWPAAATFQVPAEWPTGVYTAEVPRAGAPALRTIFWVRPLRPGATSKILFLSSVNTYQAYNNYGGGDLYGLGLVDQVTQVSFDRPYTSGTGDFMRWEQKFIAWAEKNGYSMDYASTYDLEFQPDLLAPYDVLIIAGHSEYWTWDMRQRVKDFLARGGRLVNLSGNTMWWQVRFTDKGRTMVAYKNWRADPVKDQALATDVNWDHPIEDSSFTITGLHWPFGGYPGGAGNGFHAVNASHWIYEGTGVVENQLFGKGASRTTSIHDKESDGLPFNCTVDGATILGPIRNSGTPTNFTVLGIVPVYSKQKVMKSFAGMGVYTLPGGGAVFSAGTTGWALGLQDPVVARITRNVLDRFLSGNIPPEPDKPGTEYLFYDGFNCAPLAQRRYNDPGLGSQLHQLNYFKTAGTENDRLDPACGVDGSGLRVAVRATSKGTRYESELRQNWTALDTLYTRLTVNLSAVSLGDNAGFDLFQQFSDDRQSTPKPTAVVQVKRIGAQRFLRYQPAGANLPWVAVPADKPFKLEIWWNRNTGEVGLWVNGSGAIKTVDLQATPALDRSDFGVMAASGSVAGTLCLDELVYNEMQAR